MPCPARSWPGQKPSPGTADHPGRNPTGPLLVDDETCPGHSGPDTVRMTMSHTPSTLRRGIAVVAALSSVLLGAAALTSAPATAAPQWAPAATAQIHPGTMMYTAGAQCTANFVYTDSAANVYVGYAAHCAGTGSSTDTNGCATQSLPLGTPVTFNEGGSLIDEGTVVGNGTLVYSSWLKEKELGTTDPNT